MDVFGEGMAHEPELLERKHSSVRDLIAATLATTSASLPVFLTGTLAIQMRESMHFSTSALGLAITLSYLGAAVWSIPSGRIAEAIGGVRVLRVAPILGALVLLSIGIVSRSWWHVAVLLFLAGTISASTATASNLFLSRRTNPKYQGTIFGIKQSAIPLASMIGGLAVPFVALTIGWRYAFDGSALFALASIVMVPKPSTTIATRRQQAKGIDVPVTNSGPLVLLGIGLGLGIFAATALSAFMVISAVHIGMSRGQAGFVAAIAGASAVVGRIVIGVLADRRGGRHFPVVAVMMLVGVFGYVLLALGTSTRSSLIFTLGCVVALGAGWGWNGLFNFAVVRTHRHAPAHATGITQVGGRLGGMMGPVVMGTLISHSAYMLAWSILGIALLSGALAVHLGRRALMAK